MSPRSDDPSGVGCLDQAAVGRGPPGPEKVVMESHLSFTQSQWDIVLACFVVAAFSLLATFVYLIGTKREVSARFRPSAVAGAIIGLVAFSAYLLLILSWITGFDYQAATQTYVPSDSALQFRNGYRYVDWAVTVPLLTIEMVVVSTLVGRRASRMRFILAALAFLMIVTGFLGADTFNSDLGRLVWGLISTAFFIPLYIMVLGLAFRSSRELTGPAATNLRRAGLMLAWTWGVYPLAYCVPFFFADSPGWAVGRQIAFTLTDVAAKVGYGFFIHSVAKARTATDVAEGESAHPEPVYYNSLKEAEAQPVLVSSRVLDGNGSGQARHAAERAVPIDGRTGTVDSAASAASQTGGTDTPR